MPVIGTPVQGLALTRDDIRRWLRDFPPGAVPGTGVVSALLDGVEFSDADVEAGVRGAVDRYNVMTPISHNTSAQIPRFLLLYGAAAHLMMSESFRQLRNQASAAAAGVTPTGIDDKAPAYRAFAEFLWTQFDTLLRGVKTQRNMEAMYGGLASGYAYTSRMGVP